MAEWAAARGLRPSSGPTCVCGLAGLDPADPEMRSEHQRLCRDGRSLDLLDHALLWEGASGPALLTAACYRPSPVETGHAAWAARLDAYTRPLGLTYLALYREPVPHYADATSVLYGRSLSELLGLVGLSPGHSYANRQNQIAFSRAQRRTS